jgi:hypothetical protein
VIGGNLPVFYGFFHAHQAGVGPGVAVSISASFINCYFEVWRRIFLMDENPGEAGASSQPLLRLAYREIYRKRSLPFKGNAEPAPDGSAGVFFYFTSRRCRPGCLPN